MADHSARGPLSPESSLRAKEDAVRLRELASRFETLLDQAEGFVRGGDFLGGQARARYAREELANRAAAARVPNDDIVELRHHLDLRLRHYDLLARDWQQENVARHTDYLARERKAIGAAAAQTSEPGATRRGFSSMLRRLRSTALGRWTAGAMRTRRAR